MIERNPEKKRVVTRGCAGGMCVLHSPAMASIALTVAGLDPSGGAGVAADLKTFHQHGVYGCAVASVLTVQNTLGMQRVQRVDPALIAAQLDALFADIVPHAAKTGALGSAAVVRVVAERLRSAGIQYVIDPVRLPSRGEGALLDADARTVLMDDLLPGAALITANALEAEWLCERPVRDADEAARAAERLLALGARAALVKGGHLAGETCVDTLVCGGALHTLAAPRLHARHTHGTGCTLSAAITAHLALGLAVPAACARAKAWLNRALAGAGVGRGVGSLDHFAPLPED